MAIEPISEEAIFNVARKIESTEARDEYLNQVCGDDQAVYARVSTLLRLHDDEKSFLESPPPGLEPTMSPEPFTEKPGTQIGVYKLREQIGEGGFGTVFVAQQERPVSRKVALKIIKPGMATKDVVARFEAERQALALMDHPNLAKVLDAGATDAGRPYFVMELVHGLPITEFCDDQKLSNRERLKLFIDVCRAVQHAHQKGIIHRDLKPSNIMVTMHDDQAVPKIIDFGVAKALSQKLSENSIYTAYGQMVGTPLYMSPEQAQLSGLDVDTRSDVYSLGVLLYELLTGATPFDRETLKNAGVDELRRIIREDDPPIPSARVSTLNAGLRSTASDRRKIDERKLSQSLRGELDWIVMKSLDKNRARRYESVSQLAEDIDNFLNGEPVNACPPSLAYRIRKFSQRNRVALTTASLVAMALVLGTIVSVSQAVRAAAAETAAGEEREAAVIVAERAKKSERAAQDERDRAVAAREKLRRVLYASEMNLLQVAWEQNDFQQVTTLLNETRPKPGETDLRGFEWHYWNRELNESSQIRSVPIPVRRFTFSPVGARLAAFSSTKSDCSITIWDTDTGRENRKISLEYGVAPRTKVVFSPDGTRVAFGGRPAKTLLIWDARTGKQLFELKVEVNIYGIFFSGDGNRVVYTYGSQGSKIGPAEFGYEVWDLDTDQMVFSGAFDQELSQKMLFLSPNGKQLGLAVWQEGKENGTHLQIWDVEKAAKIKDRRFEKGFSFCDLNPDGSQIVVQDSSTTDRLIVLDAQSLETSAVFRGKEDEQIYGGTVSPDGRLLAGHTIANRILVWGLRDSSDNHASRPKPDKRSPLAFRVQRGPKKLHFSSDSRTLHSGVVGDVETFKLPRQWSSRKQRPWAEGAIMGGSFNHDGTRAVLRAEPHWHPVDGDVVTLLLNWDVETDQEVWRYRHPQGNRAFGFPVYSADGRYVAVETRDAEAVSRTSPKAYHDEILILAAATGKVLQTLKTHDAFDINSIAFNPAGTHAGARVTRMPGEGFDRTQEHHVVVWSVATGEETLNVKIEDRAPRFEGFSHDGEELLIARTAKGGLLVLNAATGVQRRIIAPAINTTLTCSLSPDGKTVAVCGYQRPSGNTIVAIHDLTTGELKSRIRGIFRSGTVEWSSDGRRLAVTSKATEGPLLPVERNADISIWDPSTGRPVLHHLKGRRSWSMPGTLRFSRDSHRLLQIAKDNRVERGLSGRLLEHPIQIWDATPLAESEIENADSNGR